MKSFIQSDMKDELDCSDERLLNRGTWRTVMDGKDQSSVWRDGDKYFFSGMFRSGLEQWIKKTNSDPPVWWRSEVWFEVHLQDHLKVLLSKPRHVQKWNCRRTNTPWKKEISSFVCWIRPPKMILRVAVRSKPLLSCDVSLQTSVNVKLIHVEETFWSFRRKCSRKMC